MAHVLIMPRQGNTVESCIVCEWKVKEGDSVREDTPVCSVETDKAAFEIPAGAAGTVLKILRPDGDDVPVLEPILVIGNAGENWEPLIQKTRAEPEVRGPETQSGPENSFLQKEKNIPGESAPDKPAAGVAATRENQKITISPRARKIAYEEAVNPADISAGSGPGGRILESDIANFISARPPLSKAAKDELRKRIAAGMSSGIAGAGSGIGGRILAGELGNFTGQTAAGNVLAANIADDYKDTLIKGIRKIIADQMMKSCSGTAAFTLNSSARAEKMLDLRSRLKTSDPETGLNKITINDLILFAVSRTLPRFPGMNAHKLEGVFRAWKNIHLGVAVSTARGLMVPVIRNADKLSLTGISQRARELAEACRGGSVSPDDLRGSTFTVTNLGNLGVESFSPVINIPEAAILGVCSVIPKPAETSAGKYEILPHLGLSLTVDHAVVDGAPAAEFLKALCETIQNIDLCIIADSARR